ncbi:MAG: DUF3795 domain-containing protein [candidate division WOR-3 bacterium]|nr:MAG: DUF3795 domain-containing protein [candidate division WOR-3 bacterium]
MQKSIRSIAYCGLSCGDCFIHKGKIADLSRDLRKELRMSKFDRFAGVIGKFFKQYRNYDKTYELLGMMVKLRCKRMCRSGGGPPACKIRNCCARKGIVGCWKCETFEQCQKLDFLRAVHDDAHIKNLRILKRKGVKQFIRGKKFW